MRTRRAEQVGRRD